MVAVPRVQQPDIHPGTARAFTRGVGLAMLLFAVVYGLVTIVGGDERWSSPAYASAMQVPGAPESWGAVLLGGGLLGLLGFAVRALPVVLVGFSVCAVWSACFALSIGLAAWTNPGVGWGGVVTWFFLGLIFAFCTSAGAGRFHAPA